MVKNIPKIMLGSVSNLLKYPNSFRCPSTKNNIVWIRWNPTISPLNIFCSMLTNEFYSSRITVWAWNRYENIYLRSFSCTYLISNSCLQKKIRVYLHFLLYNPLVCFWPWVLHPLESRLCQSTEENLHKTKPEKWKYTKLKEQWHTKNKSFQIRL